MKISLIYVIVGLILNLALFKINGIFSGMLYMDMVGTMFCSFLLGPWWGAIVGCLTSVLIAAVFDNPAYVNFTIINVLVALLIGFFARSCGQIFNENNSQGKILLKVLVWGFVLSLVSTLALFIKNKYALTINIDPINSAFFSLFIVLKAESISTFASIPYDLMSSFPDKLISVALALYLICFFVNPNHFRYLGCKNKIIWNTRISIIIFIAIYAFPFYSIAINGMVIPGVDSSREFNWVNTSIWSLPLLLAIVAWVKAELSVDYYFNVKTNAGVNFCDIYEDVIKIITVIWSLLLSSQAAFTKVELNELVNDGMGMFAFISLIGLLPPFFRRYFGRDNEHRKG